MKTPFSKKYVFSIMVVISMVFGLSSFAQETKEPHTNLPLHPGLSFQQEVDSPVCGKNASVNLYDTPSSALLTEYITWYKEHMKGAHYVHKMWSNRAQEMYYSADGLTGVNITGSPSGPGVVAVAYIKMSAPLSVKQMDEFSPQKPACK